MKRAKKQPRRAVEMAILRTRVNRAARFLAGVLGVPVSTVLEKMYG